MNECMRAWLATYVAIVHALVAIDMNWPYGLHVVLYS